jgi:hypothetical protein
MVKNEMGGHVARMRKRRGVYRCIRDHLEDADERRILKWIFKKWDGGMD